VKKTEKDWQDEYLAGIPQGQEGMGQKKA